MAIPSRPRVLGTKWWVLCSFLAGFSCWFLLHADRIGGAAGGRQDNGVTLGVGSSSSRDAKKVVAIYSPQLFDVTRHARSKDTVDLPSIKTIGTPLVDFPVVRPYDAYRYDIRHFHVRRRQARVAQHNGIDAFVYQYVWRNKLTAAPGKGDTMDLMLSDGEPAIDFCLMWMSKGREKPPRWTAPETWRAHFDYVLPFFRHPRHVRRDGRPVYMVGGLDEAPEKEAAALLAQFHTWAKEEGLQGLYVVQALDRELSSWVRMEGVPAFRKLAETDALAEVVTNPHEHTSEGNGGFARHHPVSLGNPASVLGVPPTHYFRGVSTSYNNRPRRVFGGGASPRVTVHPSHPSALRAALRNKLAATPIGGMVVVNGWNNWGEGMAVEASNEFGTLWLDAIRQAKADDANDRPFPDVPPVGGLPAPATMGADTMCLLVRTFKGHDDGAVFAFRDFLMTTLRQHNQDLIVYVFNTDTKPFPKLRAIVDECLDAMQQAGQVTKVQVELVAAPVVREYSAYYSSYDVTDWVIAEKVIKEGSPCKHFTVTNGDNFYAPDAFNVMPGVGENMLLMNFMGRYALVNSIIYGHSSSQTAKTEGKDQVPPPACCDRLRGYGCMDAMPAVGYVDLGAVIFKASDWKLANLRFSVFDGACKYNSCHDGALVTYVVSKLKWKYSQHPPGRCAFLHNPNPYSCKLVGGYYWDATTYQAAGCYATPSAMGVPPEEVDWPKFVANDGCVCRSGLAYFQSTQGGAQNESRSGGINEANFDAEDYLRRYPDVARKYSDPHQVWTHFDRSGRTEGRTANKRPGLN